VDEDKKSFHFNPISQLEDDMRLHKLLVDSSPQYQIWDFNMVLFQFSHIYFLLKFAKWIKHKLNKHINSPSVYNILQHYLIEHACTVKPV